MTEELDMLGAEGLSGQRITLQIKSIDRDKLGRALGGGAKAAALPAALALINFDPKHALELAMPWVVNTARNDYGVELGYEVLEAPAAKGEKPTAGAGKGLLVGVVLGAGGAWAAAHFGLFGMARAAIPRFF